LLSATRRWRDGIAAGIARAASILCYQTSSMRAQLPGQAATRIG
jgi:hypothetical protein